MDASPIAADDDGVLNIEQLAQGPVEELAPRRPTPEERAAQRRDEIIDAAAKVFADQGFHEAGVSDIAAELGVAHGTFYRYFKSKQEIANRVLDRVIQRIAQSMLDEDPQASNNLEEWREQIGRIMGRLFDLHEQHPHLVRFLQRQSLTGDDDRLALAMDSFAAFTAGFLDNGKNKGFVRAELDSTLAAQTLVGVLFDLLRRLTRDPKLVAQRDYWIQQNTALMLRGVAAE